MKEICGCKKIWPTHLMKEVINVSYMGHRKALCLTDGKIFAHPQKPSTFLLIYQMRRLEYINICLPTKEEGNWKLLLWFFSFSLCMFLIPKTVKLLGRLQIVIRKLILLED